jgi:hypothetical protein
MRMRMWGLFTLFLFLSILLFFFFSMHMALGFFVRSVIVLYSFLISSMYILKIFFVLCLILTLYFVFLFSLEKLIGTRDLSAGDLKSGTSTTTRKSDGLQ